ncbi:von Willebrand factor type A domain-containing protein [Paenibacillus algorifonticola]|uniref:von Willebrand factor type A domain-containing protein n=1 Tax=Paenibacillus algorifonticola TaxID=684063 RepID=A0A1I2HMJ8_9BACL|nr:vWA domain-containing protein [Paenibacillus algorifonticola]SFF30663.1 von Willebrand factor type A domain-containing protein [Paenibacillus algorifonticola]
MIKKPFIRSLLFLCICSLSLSLSVPIPPAAAAEAALPTNQFDAMFVLDTSYSMTETDPGNTSAEVIHMLMDMSEAERTRIGYVAYNHSIVDSQPLTDMSVKEKRTRLKSSIESLKRKGYTDIGLGLLKGTNMLAEQRKEDSQAYVVLLSDGATDLGIYSSNRTVQDSGEDVTAAINLAKKNGFPVYTIGLNHDGTVNKAELARIAKETGGKSFMTSSAEDLPEIFNQIYADQVQSILLPVAALTAKGSLQEVPVTIANGSMSEANIILISEKPINETQLFYQSSNIRMYNSSKYTILKITSPLKGTFNLKFRGVSGDLVKIYVLANYELNGEAKLSGDQAIVKGQPTPFETQLFHPDGSPLADADFYATVKAVLTITNKDTKKSEEIPMTLTEDKLEAGYSFPISGNYSWRVRMEGPDFYRVMPGGPLTVNNLPPVEAGDGRIKLSKEDGGSDIALSTLFTDPNNDPLTFTLASSTASNRYDAAITADGILQLEPLKTGTSDLVIEATDTEGGTLTRTIKVEITSVWTLYLQIAVSVLILAIIGTVLYFVLRPKPPFAGRLEGFFLNTASGNEIPVTYWPLTSFPQHSITLQQLFHSLDINEPLPEAAAITFYAGKKGTLFVKHTSRCTLVRGKTALRKDRKEPLQYGDKLYITFEDGITEIELRYKPIKANTNIFTRPD